FKVSSLVAARRARDLSLIDADDFFEFYKKYMDKEWYSQQTQASGGNFWNIQRWRIGTRFGTAIFRAVKEGRLLYREAYNLTGLKGETFENMREKMGILPGT
ncbi:MAG: DNA-binding protein, partial [Gemmatimonadota bacterium]|nr:DNA-binding protein [Gemmatimonadota bacterium]